MIQALYQEKDGRPVTGSILNCSETTEQQTSSEEEQKEHVIRQLH